jgi:competence protein ComEC
MADWGRGHGGSRGRVGTWDVDRRRRAAAWPDADFARTFAARLRDWVIADAAPGRLLPWIPIAFGIGIAVYFSAEREPAWWAAVALAVGCATIVVLLRRRPVGLPVALALTAAAAGFAVATLKTLAIAHPVLALPATNVLIEGFVEQREERERTDRIVVRVLKLDATRISDKPDRIRVSVRKGTAPPVGSYVSFRARLNPPLAPLRPGGYDFARDLYFQRIGAVGFVLGAIKTMEPPAERGLWLRYATAIEHLRDGIDRRIRAVVPGDRGAIASALITGKRDAITAPVNDAMYISGLGHVLSISGYHMVIVAGVVFVVVRALLALIPALARRRPIKKWAALAALAAAAFYLVLSGAEVATQRAFIMTAIVLFAVLIDRAALTLRTLAIAALAVMVLAPQAVVHPSFQMSFAATLALIAIYQHGLSWTIEGAKSSIGARIALWGGRTIANLLLGSLVAGLATTLFIAFHFHRLTPYGLVANLLAMPIVSAWVMPMGLLGLVAIPFGLDGDLWRLMGIGISWMIAVAQWVAGLPGSVGRIAAFGVGPLLLATAGLVLLCLLKSPLRWYGALLLVVASAAALRAPQPEVLVAADGLSLAVRQADGRLAIHKIGSGTAFTVREWLAADADARGVTDETLSSGFICDPLGCVAKLPDGKPVALVLRPDAFAEDCSRAVLVVTPRDAPPQCDATIIDRNRLRAHGGMALRRDADRWEISMTRPPGQDRPWAKAVPQPTAAPSTPTVRPVPRDATPRVEDLEPGDAQ